MRLIQFLRRFATICRDSWLIQQSGLFSTKHYRGQYPRPGFFCRYFPLLHYVLFGAFHGKNPNPLFDASFYLAENPDVQQAGINPFAHYLRLGAFENRPCTPLMDSMLDARRNLVYFRDVMPALNPVVFHLPLQKHGKTTQGMAGGFYGFAPIPSKNTHLSKSFKARLCNRQTIAILERYGQNIGQKPPPFMLVTPLLKRHWPKTPVPTNIPATNLPATYTIVSALDEENPIYFPACAKSLEKIIAASPKVTIEWLIAAPDEAIENLQSQLPLSLKRLTRFYPVTQNNQAKQINEMAALSAGQWLIMLDAKDQLAPETIQTLEDAMHDFPDCRLILSAIADIDENGHILRHRPAFFSPEDFFEQGMPYKLFAIRRDLWESLQGFDASFTASYGYDLVLKATLQEPVLCLADPLYQYRMVAAKIFAQGGEENHAMHAIRRSFIQYFATRQLGYNPPSPKPPFSANPPRGICFVRTQGKRFDYLLDALLSIQKQTQPLMPCVIVHANDETFLKVQNFLQEHQIQAILLHAPDLKRRRGYPLNVGIDYLRAQQKDYDYLCFLDDDDIFYPRFAQTLSQALQDSGKDVVFAQTMGKSKDGTLMPIHPPLPPICLLAGNFIPINAYVVRTDFFIEAGIRFPEDVDYLEDWDILVQMLGQGATFMPVFETLAEIRLIGDGNAPFKNDPKHFEDCYRITQEKACHRAAHIGINQFLWDIASFLWSKKDDIEPHEKSWLKVAMQLITSNRNL